MESNNTMTKVLHGVDALVEEFLGEDLKADEVLRDAKKQVENEIRPLMKRNHKQSTREAASIKHVDDIDWKHLATHGGLADLW